MSIGGGVMSKNRSDPFKVSYCFPNLLKNYPLPFSKPVVQYKLKVSDLSAY